MASGFAYDGGRSADAGDTASQVEAGGGEGNSSWSIRPSSYRSLHSRRGFCSICAPPAVKRGGSPGVVDDEGSAVAVRGDGDPDPLRLACDGPPHPCCASVEAILIVAPSNRSSPAVLAADALPDLHVIEPRRPRTPSLVTGNIGNGNLDGMPVTPPFVSPPALVGNIGNETRTICLRPRRPRPPSLVTGISGVGIWMVCL